MFFQGLKASTAGYFGGGGVKKLVGDFLVFGDGLREIHIFQFHGFVEKGAGICFVNFFLRDQVVFGV